MFNTLKNTLLLLIKNLAYDLQNVVQLIFREA